MIQRFSYLLFLILSTLLPFNAIMTNEVNFGLGLPIPINVWKEVIVVTLTLLAIITIAQKKKKIKFDLLDWLIVSFFALGCLSAILQTRDVGRVVFGFKYDFEFLWLFLLLRHGFRFTDTERKKMLSFLLGAAAVVILFGILQIFVLPKDFMLLFGYSPNISSWVPGGPLPIYHAIDNNADIARVASTLSGPNQFASYLLITIPLIATFLYQTKGKWKILGGGLLILACLNLFFTYSRSAYIALFSVGIVATIILLKHSKLLKKVLLTGSCILVLFAAIITIIKPSLWSDLVIRASSTQGHFERTRDAIVYTLKNPLGYGIGNAGPASTRFNEDQIGWITESWYLQIAIELGVLGALLFIAILGTTLGLLWQYYEVNNNTMAFALFLGLTAICITSFFLHSWEESAVALTFWGIAGSVLQEKKQLLAVS